MRKLGIIANEGIYHPLYKRKATLSNPRDTSCMTFEKRKCVRFLAKDNIFAALRHGFKKVGKIIDISAKGLGFSYLTDAAESDIESRESQVDIFFGDSFHLFNLPCTVVYCDVGGEMLDESSRIKMFRCGLHFGKLSDMQTDLLNYIVTKQTVKTRPITREIWNDELQSSTT